MNIFWKFDNPVKNPTMPNMIQNDAIILEGHNEVTIL